MDIKTVLIGLVIGLLLGAGTGYGVAQSQINNLQTQITNLSSQVTTIQDQLTTKTNEMQSLNSQLTAAQTQITAKARQITTLQTQIDVLQKTVTDLQNLLPPPPPSEGQPGSSRFFPVPIGTSLTMNYVYGSSGTYTAIITVLQVTRGDVAWNQIYAANRFNEPAPLGYEYILVKISYNYINGPTINTLESLDEFTFQAFSGSGMKYNTPGIVEPDPQFDVDLYPENVYEGWAAYVTLKTDTKPMLSFAVSQDGSGGIWFKLY